MGFSLKAALAALVALAINFGCEVGLSEGAGIPGSGTAPQFWSSTHFTTITNTFPTKSYIDHSITSFLLFFHLFIIPLSVFVHKKKKRLIFVLFISQVYCTSKEGPCRLLQTLGSSSSTCIAVCQVPPCRAETYSPSGSGIWLWHIMQLAAQSMHPSSSTVSSRHNLSAFFPFPSSEQGCWANSDRPRRRSLRAVIILWGLHQINDSLSSLLQPPLRHLCAFRTTSARDDHAKIHTTPIVCESWYPVTNANGDFVNRFIGKAALVNGVLIDWDHHMNHFDNMVTGDRMVVRPTLRSLNGLCIVELNVPHPREQHSLTSLTTIYEERWGVSERNRFE